VVAVKTKHFSATSWYDFWMRLEAFHVGAKKLVATYELAVFFYLTDYQKVHQLLQTFVANFCY
jgi:hypothetical protein